MAVGVCAEGEAGERRWVISHEETYNYPGSHSHSFKFSQLKQMGRVNAIFKGNMT